MVGSTKLLQTIIHQFCNQSDLSKQKNLLIFEMKKYAMRRIYLLSIAALLFYLLPSCSAQDQKLNAANFNNKLKQTPGAVLLDVRTPEEFNKGHLVNALNIDWNNGGFEKQVSRLDKEKPVFVYCLSGGRSAAAAKAMRDDGFKKVYELEGGILKWRAAGLPETTVNKNPGINSMQYETLKASGKTVLIDFYADWCGPCRQMAPYLNEIKSEMAGRVNVIRINADDNQQLLKDLKIDALPLLILYQNNKEVWKSKEYTTKEEIVKHIKENS